MTSPDWTEAAIGVGSLTDPQGHVWTLDGAGRLMKDGTPHTPITGSLIVCKWPLLYIRGGAWWKLDVVTGAAGETSDPRPAGAPPAPAPAPTPAPAAPSPPPPNLDPDILVADHLTLQKLQFQHNRNRAIKDDAHKAWARSVEDARIAMQQEALADPETDLAEQRRFWAAALIEKSFTASTATTPAAITTWVNGCFARLDAAVAEAMRRYP